MIKKEMAKLNKPIRIKVFTSRVKQADGGFKRECAGCDFTVGLLKIYEQYSNGMLTIEEHSLTDDPEFAKKYDIQRVPTILLIDENGREVIRYLANPQGGEVNPFLQAIFGLAGAPNHYAATLQANINRINPSTIKVMITNQCPYCPEMVRVANLFAIASRGKIRTVIVDIMANPDIGKFYDAAGVPYTIINDRKPIRGIVGPDVLLRELIGGNIKITY